jgi:cobalt/nickel transport system permease protein
LHEKPLILTAAPPALLERLDPRVKLLCVATWAVCIVTLPAGRWRAVAVFGAIPLILLVLNWRLAGRFLRRVGPALPAIALLVVLLPFFRHGHPVWQWGVLCITREGIATALRVGSAATLCVVGIALVWASTPQDALLVGLRGIGLPALFVGVVGFMLRYLEVLRPELHRLCDARAARTLGRGGPGPLRSRANLVGALFLRAHGRAERVADAMAARGYTGRLRAFEHAHFHTRDVVAVILFPLAAAAVRLTLGA